MLIFDLFRMALRSLISHKLRTFLTALGIIIGVASVISMISIGEGARQQTLSTISKFGTNIITIKPGQQKSRHVTTGKVDTLILSDADIIEKHYFANNTNPRYEQIIEDSHHDHLVDITSGEVIEFFDQKLEDLKTEIAKKLGYELIDHRLDLYGKKLKTNNVK